MTTFLFLLRWQLMQFAIGGAAFFLGMYGFSIYSPILPHAEFVSVVGMFGPWPYLVGAVFGAFMMLRAWQKSSRRSTKGF